MTSFLTLLGFVIGLILAIIPEPVTTILGLSMAFFSAYKMGWLGKGGLIQ